MILAKALQNKKVEITLGRKAPHRWPYQGAIDVARSLGAHVVEKAVYETHIDEKNKIVTSPAFMYDGELFEAYDSAANMVREVLKLIDHSNK